MNSMSAPPSNNTWDSFPLEIKHKIIGNYLDCFLKRPENENNMTKAESVKYKEEDGLSRRDIHRLLDVSNAFAEDCATPLMGLKQRLVERTQKAETMEPGLLGDDLKKSIAKRAQETYPDILRLKRYISAETGLMKMSINLNYPTRLPNHSGPVKAPKTFGKSKNRKSRKARKAQQTRKVSFTIAASCACS